jgi:hypothetical protein
MVRDDAKAVVNDTIVYSLAFGSPAAGYGNFARWDCLNGWTTRIEDAVV